MLSEQERQRRFKEFYAMAQEVIAEHGVMVQGVFPREGDPGTPFFYTGGLTARGWPELVIMGGHQLLGQYVQHIAQMMLDNDRAPVVGHELRVEGDEGVAEFRLGAVSPAWVDYNVTLPGRAGLGEPVGAVQVIWADDKGRWPGGPGWEDFKGQPLLAEAGPGA